MKKRKRLKLKIHVLRSLCLVITLFFFIGVGIFTYSEFVSRITEETGISGNIVRLNDLEKDWYYYTGLNYTTSTNGTLPTQVNKNYYNETNLVQTTITYKGLNIEETLHGYVSLDERQDTYIYHKYYPVNDGYITIELIDNPFTDRPTDKGFNGWLTDSQGVSLSYDDNYYKRYAKVPVTFTDGKPDDIEITFYASWIDANIGYINGNSNWSNAFANLENKGMIQRGGYKDIYEDVTGLYTRGEVNNYSNYPNNAVDSSGSNLTGMCFSWGGSCTYYMQVTANNYNPDETYYQLRNRNMYVYTVQIIGQEEIPPLASGTILANYYQLVTISNGQPYSGYYNELGVYQESGTCTNSSGCEYYKLLNYYDENGNVLVANGTDIYYYLVTRETNIIVMQTNTTTVWDSSNAKPFTLTSLHNQSKSDIYWNVQNLSIKCYADTTIENITIRSTQGTSSSNPSSSQTATRYFYGNYFNVKIGRGITNYNNYRNFNGAYGGDNNTNALGSTSNTIKYRFTIESGYYNTITLTNGPSTTSRNKYVEAQGVYGNDYDRASKNNSNLDVYFVLCGSWGSGYYYANNQQTGITFSTTVKSGSYGTGKYNHTTGIYVGGRSYGSYYAARSINVEGGYIYNLIGGPISADNRSQINDIYMYITGGEIDMVVGGAGTSTTYGNRIIQATGGTINYSVFGGSNGYDGSSSDGKLSGSSYIYVGGTATIGNSDYVANENTLWGSEAGSVFGIGNGKEGTSTIGSNDNSNIIIADSAIVNQNVYGGGNYGATGISSSNSTTETNITMIGGTIKGSLYGGGNKNGSGSSSILSTINIKMTGGTIEGSLYGGSNQLGVIYGSTAINMQGGVVKGSIYGGGEGGYENATNTGTFVSRNVDVTIGNNDVETTPVINTNVYGGSAFGTVNGETETTTLSSYNTKVTVNKAFIDGAVYGGGEGSDTFDPYIEGNVEVYINGGTINNVFGGNDSNGNINGYSKVFLNGGIVTNTFGGSNKTSAKTTYVYLQGGTSTNIFGGSNEQGDVPETNIITTSGNATTIYGGNNIGGTTTTSNITVDGGNITTIYGGGKLATTTTTNVLLNKSNIDKVFGGGESADINTLTNVTLNGSTVNEIYGGSDATGNVPTTNITVTTGKSTTIYGGNNMGGKTVNSNIKINGGEITTIYGGGNEAITTKTLVDLNNGIIDVVYGGANKADIEDSTNVNLKGSSVTTIYGGSNQSGTVLLSNIETTNGDVDTIFGGNNQGGTTTTTDIKISGSSINNIYGGGNEAVTSTGNIVVNKSSNKIQNIYGGGKQANVETTNVTLNGGLINSVFGGSNQNGTVTNSNIKLPVQSETPPTSQDVTFLASYDIKAAESWQTTVYKNVVTIDVTLTNNTSQAINSYDASLIINDSVLWNNYSNTEIVNNNGVYTFNEKNRYYGINSIPANGTYTFQFTVFTNQNIDDFEADYIFTYTDNSQNEVTSSSSQGVKVDNIYGGNNQGGKTINASIDGDTGTVTNIYGGGNFAITDDTNVNILNMTIKGTIYGGGNQAGVTNSSLVYVNNTTVNDNVFGGGNLGTIGKNTKVNVTSSNVNGSIYAGGNGSTATVYGNTLLNIDGQTTVKKHVFGGGNAAMTGTEEKNNSTSEVNIAGATIDGNVYGGANTSVLYGRTTLNIGQNVVSEENLTAGDVHIKGTVFGGGEANASGSDEYDYKFISVTIGIEINIEGTNHSAFSIDGSIFGSGNASSTTGYSYINIKNYGTRNNYKHNISLQRANIVTLDNSHIEFDGATDRTNEFSDTLFSISRIDQLKMKNSSTLYLMNGSNLLQEFTSLADGSVETLQTVTINDDDKTVTKNGDNRVYMFEGKNLNIATNENVTSYGEVSGMTFFGMYNHDRDGKAYTALYSDRYNYQSDITSNELYYFVKGSYVLGLHKSNHDITKDGFYTNYEDENNPGKVQVKYIDPTPEEASFYMWVVGEAVAAYDVDLTASKYSTLGTYELQLLNHPNPNSIFSIVGFAYNELDSNVNLLTENEIPRIAASGTAADNNMGLVMRTGNYGWITNGSTTFLTNDEGYSGTLEYQAENSTDVPSLLFYLYHSKNLQTSGKMGTVTISMLVITPIDELNNDVERVNINVNLSRALYGSNEYEGTITPGKEYKMFATSIVDITTTSSFSAYYSLFAESETDFYKTGYHRSLVSSWVFPEKTKITMIDLHDSTNPEYYYYVVTSQDVIEKEQELITNSEVSYNLSKFIRMGSSSSSNNYNDEVANNKYYDSDKGYANEEFIFIFDFSESNLTSDQLNNQILIELRNDTNHALISVLGIQHSSMMYDLYYDKNAYIDVDATLSEDTLYIGKNVNLTVNTDFIQQKINSDTIYDTNYFDHKLGIKLSIYDEDGKQVQGSDLLGVTFIYNGINYYPRIDGTIRFKLAETVAKVSSKIKIDTKNSNLSSGDYTIKIESFHSPDGIYYGLVSSDYVLLPIKIINSIYGLSASINDEQVIIDKTTGKHLLDSNVLTLTLGYSSGLDNPNVRISLYRRKYEEIYQFDYEIVDFKNYFANEFTETSKEYEYLLTSNPTDQSVFYLSLKENLISGTYRIVLSLYDGESFIGDVYQYIVIK